MEQIFNGLTRVGGISESDPRPLPNLPQFLVKK